MKTRLLLSLGSLALAGCGAVGVQGEEFGQPPRSFRVFSHQKLEGAVYAQASIKDQVSAFGVDLVEAAGVVPIHLQVQLSGAGSGAAGNMLLGSGTMGLRLVLADGGVLKEVPLQDVVRAVDDEDVEKKLRALKFPGGLLTTTPMSGYVFFELAPPTEYAMVGRTVRHGRNGIVHSFDVADSLVSFDIDIGNGKKVPFFVGVEH